MPANRVFTIIILLLSFLYGCIEPFTPKLEGSQQSLVVEGFITDKEGEHYVRISQSAPYNVPQWIPVPGCSVEIVDEEGNRYIFSETEEGRYSVWMPQESLIVGMGYRLMITTPDGRNYQSGYEKMPGPCPPMDSIHYDQEIQPTEDPRINIHGLQFSVDMNANDTDPRNFRWTMVETWRYHSAFWLQYFYDSNEVIENIDPFSLYYCWKTERVREIFTASTSNLTENRLTKYPLHFVDTKSTRLQIRYSVLIRQYAMSDESYAYWNQMQEQMQETGGLYETQPVFLKGNVYNIDDPGEVVLGRFDVNSVFEKRIFLDKPPEFSVFQQMCAIDSLRTNEELMLYSEYSFGMLYMISLSETGEGFPYGTAHKGCFDCRYSGGTLNEPDFWVY